MSHLLELQPDSFLSYLIAVLFPALDAILPLVPSESAIVALGVATAGSFDPRLFLLVMLAATGAVIGDNLCYVIGRHFGPWVDRRIFSSERGSRHRKWAQNTLERFGARLIIVCRFIPGGRTVVTFTCGAVGYPWRRFLPATMISGAIWATYAFAIGRIGGTTFANKPWIGLVVALGLALIVSLLAEVVRRIVSWRRRVRMNAGSVKRDCTSRTDSVRTSTNGESQMCSGGTKVSEQRPPTVAAVKRAGSIPKKQPDLSHPSDPDRTGPLETLGQSNELTTC